VFPLFLLPLLGAAGGAGLGAIEGGDDIWKGALMGGAMGAGGMAGGLLGGGSLLGGAASAGGALPGVPAGLSGIGGTSLGKLGLGSSMGATPSLLGGAGAGLSGVPPGLNLGMGPAISQMGAGTQGMDMMQKLMMMKQLGNMGGGQPQRGAMMPPPQAQPMGQPSTYGTTI
jgi:hypothetical protein